MPTIKTTDRILQSAMTVQDLIDALQGCPKDARVLFACDYGDIGHTRQALQVETVDAINDWERLIESAYSQSDMAIASIDEDDEEDDDDEYEAPNVVILR